MRSPRRNNLKARAKYKETVFSFNPQTNNCSGTYPYAINRKKNKINKHSTTESLALLPVRKQVLFQIKNIYKVFVIKLAINILYKRKMWRVIPILFQEHFLRTSIFFQCSLLKGRAFQIEKSFWISSSYLMLCRATGK